MSKKNILGVIAAFVLSTSVIIYACNKVSGSGNSDSTQIVVPIINPDTSISNVLDTIRIVAVGDMMLGTLYPSDSYLPPDNDCSPLLMPLHAVLSNAHLTFGNLEGVFTDTRDGAKKCNDPNTCYTFGMPSSFVNCFVNAGFDYLSVANNHTADFGETGRKNTVKLLDDHKINWSGLDYKPSVIFEINGIKFGVVAFAPNQGTAQITDYELLKEEVKKLRAECKIVIVSFHGGAEGKAHQHVTRNYETFLGQNRGNVYKFAHIAIDAGADLVLGHGPHVTRAVEIYKNKFIAYSMGNFATYSRISIQGESGLAPILKINLDTNGNFLNALIVPTFQIKYQGGPKIDSQKRVINIIQKLTAADFPDGQLKISNDGLITKK